MESYREKFEELEEYIKREIGVKELNRLGSSKNKYTGEFKDDIFGHY